MFKSGIYILNCYQTKGESLYADAIRRLVNTGQQYNMSYLNRDSLSVLDSGFFQAVWLTTVY